MIKQRKPPFKAPVTDEERQQVFEEMLRRSSLALRFERAVPEPPSDVPMASAVSSFATMVKDKAVVPSVSVTLVVSFKGSMSERAFFREEMDRLLQHHDQRTREEKGRSTSAVTITHPEDAVAVLQRYAGIAGRTPDAIPTPAIKTYVSPALCERTVVGYLGETKPSVGQALAGFLSRSNLRDAKILSLMVSQGIDTESAGNVSALQYYCRRGSNPKEVKSPAH